MAPTILAAATACIVTAVALRWLLSSALARSVIDVPNERSLHAVATPRVGGLAIAVGLGAGLLVVRPEERALLAAAAGYAALVLVSALDDRSGLPAGTRLLAHLAVASAWAAASLALPAWAIVTAVLALVWSANLYNFMDGSDGMAGGMALIGFGTMAAGALLAGQPALAGVAACASGCAAAFLWWNMPPARVFLGDAGSVPLGFLAAALGLYGWQSGAWSAVFAPAAFFPFAFDATLTLMRRIIGGARPWEPHREHLYQRAVRSGQGHARVARAAHVLMACCGAVALSIRTASFVAQAAAALALFAGGLGVALLIDRSYAAKCPSSET